MTPSPDRRPPDAVFYLSRASGPGEPPDFTIAGAEGDVERVLGPDNPLLGGVSLRSIFPAHRVEAMLAEFAMSLDTGMGLERDVPVRSGILPASWLGLRIEPHGEQLRIEVTDLTADKLHDVRRAAAASQRELLFDLLPIGIVIHGPDGRVVDANPAFATLTGLLPADLYGRTLDEVAGLPHQPIPGTSRTQVRSSTGVVHAVEITTASLPHGYHQLIVRDLTALEESEERFRAAFEEAGAGMAIVMRDGRNLRVNRAMCELMGYTEPELLQLTWKDLVHPDDLGHSLSVWDAFDRGVTSSLRSEKRYYHRDGHEIWVHVILSMVRDHAGKPLYFLAQVEDISERRRLAVALRDSEQRFRSAFEQSAVGMALLSPKAETLRINQALADILEQDFERARTLQWHEILHPDDRADAGESLGRVARGETSSSRAERRYVKRDGSTVWVHVTVSPVLDDAGQPQYLLAQIEDISERHRLTTERQEMEERLELVLDATDDGIWDWNCQTGDTYYGPQWIGMLGYPAVECEGDAEVFRKLVHPDDAGPVWQANEAHRLGRDNGTYDQTFRMRRADGTWAWIRSRGRVVSRDAAGKALRMAGTHTDVSEQRHLEEQHRQSQKMEAIGQLAGGVAHDFNNLIAVISATTELLLDDQGSVESRRDDLHNIAMACDRAKTLTRQLLSFSRQEVERSQVIAIDTVIDDIRPLLHRVMGPNQNLEFRRGAGGVHVRLDPGQLELAVINLVANSRDAMPGGGDVAVVTSTIIVDASNPPDTIPALQPGSYVALEVIDTGAGIDPAARPRLFEPFFTTKPHGKGTGLGLPTVSGFVERIGGAVGVRSIPGRGSTFTLYFPIAVVSTAPPSKPTPASPTPREGTRRILVVDDDDVVRTATRRLLQRRGFVVVEASDATTALGVLADDDAIEVVLSDHAMPGRTGRQLLADVEVRYPDVRRVLMSGFAGDGMVRGVLPDLGVQFVPKPFTIDELIAAIGQ
ncbi:MAG: PAS domain S-box protein [Gemmatimonadales bacterium]